LVQPSIVQLQSDQLDSFGRALPTVQLGSKRKWGTSNSNTTDQACHSKQAQHSRDTLLGPRRIRRRFVCAWPIPQQCGAHEKPDIGHMCLDGDCFDLRWLPFAQLHTLRKLALTEEPVGSLKEEMSLTVDASDTTDVPEN
jgi:hypothetical protein